MFSFTQLRLPGLVRVDPDVHRDERGFFAETYRRDEFVNAGMPAFVQDSHSHSARNVIRGLKFQYDQPTAKLVRVAYGSVFAVAADIRPHSQTRGQWEGIELSGENQTQFFVPFGFAFGFCVTSESADVLYKLSAVHNGAGGGTIRWDDATIDITWPTDAPIVAETDKSAPTFEAWLSSDSASAFAKACD